MSKGEIHLGDTTKFIVTVKDENGNAIDISTATKKQLIFRRPTGDLVPKDAQFLTDGSEGKMYYLTTKDDLDMIGDNDDAWEVRAYIEMGSDLRWHTDITPFTVKR